LLRRPHVRGWKENRLAGRFSGDLVHLEVPERYEREPPAAPTAGNGRGRCRARRTGEITRDSPAVGGSTGQPCRFRTVANGQSAIARSSVNLAIASAHSPRTSRAPLIASQGKSADRSI